MQYQSRAMMERFTRDALDQQRKVKWHVTRLGVYMTGCYTLAMLYLESRRGLWDALYLADAILLLLTLVWLPYIVSLFRYANGTYGATTFEVSYIDKAIRAWQEEQGIALPQEKQREQNVARIRERMSQGHFINVPDSS